MSSFVRSFQINWHASTKETLSLISADLRTDLRSVALKQQVRYTSSLAQGFQRRFSLLFRITVLSRLRLTFVQCAAGLRGLVGCRRERKAGPAASPPAGATVLVVIISSRRSRVAAATCRASSRLLPCGELFAFLLAQLDAAVSLSSTTGSRCCHCLLDGTLVAHWVSRSSGGSSSHMASACSALAAPVTAPTADIQPTNCPPPAAPPHPSAWARCGSA